QPSAIVLSDDDDRVLVPGDSALDEEEIQLGIAVDDGQPDLGRRLRSHLAGHLLALEDARGRRRGADRAGLADVVRAGADRAAMEAVPLDRPLEALADRDPGDLHLFSGLERLDRHGLAGRELVRAADLHELPVRPDVVL